MRIPPPPLGRRRSLMSRHSIMCFFMFVAMAAFAVLPVSGLPMMLLKTSGAKCVMVDAAHETTLLIHYLTPDATIPEEEVEEEEEELEVVDEEEESSGISEDAENASATVHLFGKHLTDRSFGEKYKKRMLDIKKKALKNRDMNILVVSRPHSILGKQGHNVLVNKHRGTQKIQHQIEDTEGFLEFETGKIDGHVEICVQSLSATRQSPSRVALNITARATADENAFVDQPQNEPPLVIDPTALYQLHTSHITGEMTRLHNRIREIVSNAEYSRDVEVGFHQQSVSLNKAVRYWPAFRILILIVAGYLQVSYVLAYLKSRHYI